MPEATYFSDTAKQLNSGLTAKTASTYAATDLIQLYANDGTPNGKISRSDLMEAVKASLPSLLSDQSTNAANILTMIADGTLGKTTAANLASILGAVAKKGDIPENTDFNTITTPGMYAFNGDYLHGCSNYPFKTGTLIVFNSSGVAGGGNPKTQLFVTYTGGLFTRAFWVNGWSDWKAASTAAFLNSYSSLADLASALSGVSTSVEKNGGTITVNTGIFAVGHPAFGYCVVGVSEQNNTGVFVEVGGATLSSLDVALARTGFHTFTITNNNTSATMIVKPIMWIHES